MGDKLADFGYRFQIKFLVALLTDKSFLEQISDILQEEFFDSDANKWLVHQIKAYYEKYSSTATFDALKISILSVDNDILKATIVEHLRDINKNFNAPDLEYVKEKALQFCKNQKLKSAIMQSITLLENEQYDDIKVLIDEASHAGEERDLGHDYSKDFEYRYEESNRKCVKTNWNPIDDLMSGGLGAGELGVVVGSAGSGKCIGKNTEIEIEYEEIGLQLTRKITMWFKPWDKIDLGGGKVIKAYDAAILLATTGIGKTSN